MSIVCKFQTAVFDVNEKQNYLTCRNPACDALFCTLVNSYLCNKCSFIQLGELHCFPEREYEKRSAELIDAIISTSCSQCSRFNQDAQNCQLIHNSKTIPEMIEDSTRHCPRHLW